MWCLIFGLFLISAGTYVFLSEISKNELELNLRIYFALKSAFSKLKLEKHTGKQTTGLCNLIEEALYKQKIICTYVNDIIPEYNSFKPKNTYSQYWWIRTDFNSRINVLKKLLKIYKKKIINNILLRK